MKLEAYIILAQAITLCHPHSNATILKIRAVFNLLNSALQLQLCLLNKKDLGHFSD